jgi:SAM-dependent MidA family methyltransferase
MTDRKWQLTSILQSRIRRAGGWIPFDGFMNAALYEPGLGYYESQQAFGERGDFVTASSMGRWLSLALMDLIDWGWRRLGSPDSWCLIEQGGGDGRLLVDLVQLVRERGLREPAQVIAVEASEHMRERQRENYDLAGIEVKQVARLSDVDRCENGLMFCNELLDAMPVRCFEYAGEKLYERGVINAGEGFGWQRGPEVTVGGPRIPEDIRSGWTEGYISEWNPGLENWQREVASAIGRGYIFCVDYGYPRKEYYRPQRREGTLLAHSGHRTREDVLTDPGSMDITAHVDFSALRLAGIEHGLLPVTFMSQGAWLAQSPSVQEWIENMAASPDQYLDEMSHLKRLMLPFGMGEIFKLYVQASHAPVDAPPYLSRFNRLDALA